MTRFNTFFQLVRTSVFVLAICSLCLQCSEEETVLIQPEKVAPDFLPPADTSNHSDDASDCHECAYIVPANVKVIDGKKLGLVAGNIIGLNSEITYGTLEFHNIVGTPEQPIIIKNFGGPVNIIATDKWHAVKTERSKYFRITGGTKSGVYGIRVQGGEMGFKLDGLSTNFEVDHVEVSYVRFAGIMAKTDPTCNDATIRGNFTMYDVSLHDNYVHHTGGEGFYVGNSFWDGMERECGLRLPHEIKGLKIFNNKVDNAGWEAIQVGCAIEGAEIYDNVITNYGTVNRQFQNNGIQIGAGTGGLVYSNLVKDGPGNGMIIMGTGDNIIYNNIIVGAGSNGVFCDERYTPGEGFKFINNTIINPRKDGIRLFAELVPMNMIVNNLIVNPGTYGTYANNDEAFVYLMSRDVRVTISNNLFARSADEVQFVDHERDNYRLKAMSPAINYGRDISRYNIPVDFYQSMRKKGSAYDAGASEH